MAHFNHAFGKSFYAKDILKSVDAAGVQQTSVSLDTVGEFAFLDGKYDVLDAGIFPGVGSSLAGFYLAQASFQPNDKIGNNPGHGGYKESSKSKLIKFKYISDMWITKESDETAATASVEIKPTAADKSCFPCGSDPIFRVDIKGTAALRLLNHNAYASLSGSLPMVQDGQLTEDQTVAGTTVTIPANGVDMCCTTPAAGIAPSIVAANLRDQFNNDPILKRFGTAKLLVNIAGAGFTVPNVNVENAIYAGGALGVANLTNAAAGAPVHDGTWRDNDTYKVEIKLKTSCELQTQFTSCSFDTRDFYLMGGLKVSVDLQDETGNPCVPCQGYVIESSTDFKQRRTSSETAIRDILLTENYRQSPYNQGLRDSSRFREQEGMSGIVTELGRDNTTNDCKGEYRVYHLLHNIPRFNNPTGVFDNDQYHYKIYVKHDAGANPTNPLNLAWEQIAARAEVTTLDGDAIVSTFAELEKKGGIY